MPRAPMATARWVRTTSPRRISFRCAIQGALGQRPGIEVYGTDYPTPDGTPVRDYVHVADLADAHVRALAHLIQGGQSRAFNLGTGRGHSVLEVLAAVARVCGRPVPVVAAPRRPGDSPTLVADASDAEKLLDWRPWRSDLATIIRTALAWERSGTRRRARLRAGGRRPGPGRPPWPLCPPAVGPDRPKGRRTCPQAEPLTDTARVRRPPSKHAADRRNRA